MEFRFLLYRVSDFTEIYLTLIDLEFKKLSNFKNLTIFFNKSKSRKLLIQVKKSFLNSKQTVLTVSISFIFSSQISISILNLIQTVSHLSLAKRFLGLKQTVNLYCTNKKGGSIFQVFTLFSKIIWVSKNNKNVGLWHHWYETKSDTTLN